MKLQSLLRFFRRFLVMDAQSFKLVFPTPKQPRYRHVVGARGGVGGDLPRAEGRLKTIHLVCGCFSFSGRFFGFREKNFKLLHININIFVFCLGLQSIVRHYGELFSTYNWITIKLKCIIINFMIKAQYVFIIINLLDT